MIHSSSLGESQVVHVVDDDADVRAGLSNLLTSMGFRTASFASPDAFIQSSSPRMEGCLLLDLRFPDADGLDFQEKQKAGVSPMPVIIMTGHADFSSSIRGMKAGAIDFLLKPLAEEALLNAVTAAFAVDRERQRHRLLLRDLHARYATLTPREKQVLELVTAGLMNKQIAGELILSEITVKVHRGSMVRKMRLRTLPDLVRAWETLKASLPNDGNLPPFGAQVVTADLSAPGSSRGH